MIFPSSYSPYLSLSNYLFEMNKRRRRKILSILHYLSCFPKISKQTIHIPSNCLVLNASFLLFLPPLFSCLMSHGRAKDREKERSRGVKARSETSKIYSEGDERGGGRTKPATMSKLFREDARALSSLPRLASLIPLVLATTDFG